MRRTLTASLILLSLLASAHAQQGWAPTVTPIDAAVQPLPKMRGTQRSAPAEEPAVQLPAEAAGPALLPLPFADQRRGARGRETPPASSVVPVRMDAPPPGPPLETPLAKGYCTTVGTLASDAKFAWQKKAIAELATDLDERIARLEAKTEEYKAWLARRDEFSKRVTDNLVVIYSRMRAEAAGQQLMAMDEETAAAVIMKLDPRVSSAILNDMNPQHAARLTSIISGAARTNSPPPPKQAQPTATGPTPAPVPAPEKKS